MELRYKNSAHISDAQLEDVAASLEDYRIYMRHVADNGGYTEPECSFNLPFDREVFENTSRVAEEKRTDNLKFIIVVGIGGSNLGTKAIYDSLYGYFDGVEPKHIPKMFFLDTNNGAYLRRILSYLKNNVTDSGEILINVVSKSGGTIETIANAEFIVDTLKHAIPNITDRIVVTTNYNSNLWKVAEEKGIAHLDIPELVGGRYSVLSSVGLFPLTLLGLNVGELLRGAQEMRGQCLEEVSDNPALQSAIILAHNYREGRVINDNFIFNSELESIGKWYRQLMGESIGKEQDLDGNIVHVGITPMVSIGSTDLHSVGQLYLGGPQDKLTTFIWAKDTTKDPTIPSDRFFPELVGMIEGKSSSDIMQAILEGVKIEYQKKNLPYMEIVFPEISEYTLGQFLQFKMMEMMYLGKLLNVNIFDQPNVESYKTETKHILEKK